MGFNGGKSERDTPARRLAERKQAATMPRELILRESDFNPVKRRMRVVSLSELGLTRRTDNGR